MLVPLLSVAPVFGRELEALEAHFLPLFKTPQLLISADLEPELHDHVAGSDELRFEIVDLGIRSLPFGGRGEALHPLDQHPPIPAAIVDRELSVTRERAPEAPEVG